MKQSHNLLRQLQKYPRATDALIRQWKGHVLISMFWFPLVFILVASREHNLFIVSLCAMDDILIYFCRAI